MQSAETHAAVTEQEYWQGITNPVAQQVAQEVFRHLSTGALERYSWKLYAGDSYQVRIRRSLERSGLAQKIASGTDALELIFDYMPHNLKPLDWRSQVKTPGAFVVHVMRNLEWYLKPPAAVRIPDFNAALEQHGTSFVILIVAIFSILTAGYIEQSYTFALKLTPVLLIAIIPWSIESFVQGSRYDSRCAEFIRYLIATYADREED